jgi:hypothetical protein
LPSPSESARRTARTPTSHRLRAQSRRPPPESLRRPFRTRSTRQAESPPAEYASVLDVSLGLSRAWLGKMIIFSVKWLQGGVFLTSACCALPSAPSSSPPPAAAAGSSVGGAAGSGSGSGAGSGASRSKNSAMSKMSGNST